MQKPVFWIGSYATPEQKGLWKYCFDGNGFTVLSAYAGLTNPSYAAEHPLLPVLYTVEETEEGAVCAWRTEENRLEKLGRISAGGASPCHLSVSEDGRWLYCANYMGGSAACFRLDSEGILVERTDLRQHTGKGPNAQRQEAAHAHCVFLYRGRIAVCDLGEDRIYLYKNRGGVLEEKACLKAPPGSGPRHLAAHTAYPGRLYGIGELSGEVLVWQETAEGFELLKTVPTLPQGFTDGNTAAAIRFTEDGRWLLISHRGADGIAALPMDGAGNPGIARWSPCVRGPRDFLICGDTVIVGSQSDGEIRAYMLEEGKLEDTGFRAEVPEPTCLQKALR